MQRTTLIVSLGAFLTSGCFGQSFEVASVRPSGQQMPEQASVGLHIDGAQVRITYLPLKDYIAIAYQVKNYQVSGPDWISTERFDVSATLPAGSSTKQLPEMLQNLLKERFGVKLHREKKDFPVYALEIGKSPLKLQESAPDANAEAAENKGGADVRASGSSQGVSVNLGGGSSYTFADNKFDAKKLRMPDLAGNLERFMDRPIVDMTDLKGTYDFTLQLTEEDYRVMLIRAAVQSGIVLPPQALRLLDNGSPTSLFDAIQKLGLKLDARKAPLDLLVVDEARKTPTEN